MMLKFSSYLVVFCGIFVNCARVKPLQVACKNPDKDLSKCVLEKIEYYRPLLLRGIPEINFPALDPIEYKFISVNESLLGDLARIDAVVRNVKVTGFTNTKIEHLMVDPSALTGEMRATVPQLSQEMEYKVRGGMGLIHLESEGSMRGNYSNIKMYIKGSVKTEDRNGVKYYQVKKLSSKIRIGYGHVKLISKNPYQQFVADLISNFYNQYPNIFISAFDETGNKQFVIMINQILDSLPAAEWTHFMNNINTL